MNWTQTDLAYLAGIIDGEGCFCIQNPGGRSHTLRMFVMNTHKGIIDYLYETYGGFQYSRKPKDNKCKIRHEWFVDRERLDEIMKLIHPFLIIKKKQCEVAMEFRNTFVKSTLKYHKVPDYIKAIRENCHSQMRVLNKKGL